MCIKSIGISIWEKLMQTHWQINTLKNIVHYIFKSVLWNVCKTKACFVQATVFFPYLKENESWLWLPRSYSPHTSSRFIKSKKIKNKKYTQIILPVYLGNKLQDNFFFSKWGNKYLEPTQSRLSPHSYRGNPIKTEWISKK